MHREHAEYAEAAADYARAADLSGDPWLDAESFVNRALAAQTEADECEARSFERIEAGQALTQEDQESQACAIALRSVHDGIRDEITAALTGTHGQERAALLWARGAIAGGNGPDQRPAFERRLAAFTDLNDAARLAPKAPRPLLSQLRTARNALRSPDAAHDETFETALEDARRRVKAAKKKAPGLVPHLWRFDCAVAYEEARIELAAREWEHARACLKWVLDHDPGHQAANVWLVYCDRIRRKHIDNLIRRINQLMDRSESKPTAHEDAGPARKCVYEPVLVAELLTERASLLEEARTADAEADYREAISRRPAMWYARRGLMRCLALQGDVEEAERQGERARRLAESLAPDGEPPPDLLVEMARVKVAAGEYQAAEDLFKKAETLRPGYLYTYKAWIAMLRGLERPADAIALGKRALQERAVEVMHDGGIHVELGHAYMASLDYEKASTCFRAALETDDAGEVQERAHLGIAAVHRLTRRLRNARAELELLPDAPGAWHSTAWLQGEIGDYGKALKNFEKTRQLRPLDPVVMGSYARALRQLGRPTAALAFLKARLNDVHTLRRARILNEAGWTQLDLRDYDGALESFREARTIEPRMGASLRGLMVAEWHQAHTTEVLDQGIARAAEAVVEPPPVDVLAGIYNEAGLCCLRDGELNAGRRYFAKSLELVGSKHRELRELLLMMQAHGLLDADASADADARIREAEATGPDLRDHPRVVLLRARWRHMTGDLDGALALFKKVREAWPDCGHALTGMASVHFAWLDYERAEAYLRAVTAAAPQNVPALELLAWTLVRRHENESARGARDTPHLSSAAELCDEVLTLEAERAGAYECLGVIALLRSQLPAAEAYMSAAVACDPKRAEAYRNKAAVYLRMARNTDAIDCLETALRCRGQQQITRLLLGHAYSEVGTHHEAAANLRQAIRLDPGEPLAYDLLASSLERQSDYRGACQVMTEALTRVPRGKAARTHLGRCRVRCAQAADTQVKQESNALLDQALRDADDGLRLAEALPPERSERTGIIGDAHYHRGVVLHSRGLERPALWAFKAARKHDPLHQGAMTAISLLQGVRSYGDAGERRVRRWGNALAVIALASAIGAVLMELAMGGWKASGFKFFPLAYVLAGAVVVAIIGITLPRLVGLSVGGQVDIRISAPRDIEPVAVTLRFERLDTLPATMMVGPGAMPAPDLPYDAVGEPSTG
jgi:tetratricopeptide (TPR) repeat protein